MSDATDLKQRFALVRIGTARSKQLVELLASGKFSKALALGEQLGLPITRGVVRVDFSRARHAP